MGLKSYKCTEKTGPVAGIALVKEGDQVKAGQPLIRFDIDKIKAAGYSDTVAVLLTNSDDLEGVECGLQ